MNIIKCDICGRDSSQCNIRNIKGMNLCPKHLTQWYRYKTFVEFTIYDRNEYLIRDNHAEIVLRDKNCKIVGKALVDLDDVEKCKQYKWHLKKSRNTSYAIATLNEKEKIFLHRLVMDYDGESDIDHIDRNGLNNKKNNLKICSHSENLRNQSINRKGIYETKSGRFRAAITINYKSIYLGTYDTIQEAYEKREEAEKKLKNV